MTRFGALRAPLSGRQERDVASPLQRVASRILAAHERLAELLGAIGGPYGASGAGAWCFARVGGLCSRERRIVLGAHRHPAWCPAGHEIPRQLARTPGCFATAGLWGANPAAHHASAHWLAPAGYKARPGSAPRISVGA